MKFSTKVAAIATTALAAAAGADTWLIDIGSDESFRGASVSSPDGNGNHWTSVWGGAFYENIADITGATTAVDFGFSYTGGEDSFNGPAGDTTINGPADTVYNAAALGNLGIDEAVYDFYVDSGFQIQNLDVNQTYDITFFGSHKFNSDDVTRYSVTDSTFANELFGADLFVGTGNDHNQDTTVTLTNIAPQADGIIYIRFQGANGGQGYLNALQIDLVPAPGAVALLGMSGLAAVRRRR